ncbi:MAG: hypothetical protein JKY02_10785 [Flavobacteriaceae bacterium]|nr:hypothetical protein [Flavobacteriaceae bacterium]
MTLEYLQEKIHINKNKISLFNRLILFFGILFMATSFLAFYISSVLQVEELYEMIFAFLLVVIILSMLFFKGIINKKEKQNKKFDYKMYKLLKLKPGK